MRTRTNLGKGIFRANVEAGQTWALHYLGTPPETFKYSLQDAEKDDWYRFSTCIGTATITEDGLNSKFHA